VADGRPSVILGDSQVFAPQMTRAFRTGLAHARTGRRGAAMSDAALTPDVGREPAVVAPFHATPSLGRTRARTAVLVAVNLLGLLAFLWPFVLPMAPGVNENHRADAPLILVVLLVCLGGVLFVELGRGGLGPGGAGRPGAAIGRRGAERAYPSRARA
jgi:hypothetical protein